MSTKVGSIHYDLDLDDKGFKSKLASASSQFQGLGSQLKEAERGSQMFAGGLVAIGAAGLSALGFGTRFAADLETMTQGFVTLLGSTEKADAAITMIKRDAARTPFELPGLIQANQLLTSVTKDAQTSERFLLNIGKALTAMGRGQPELDRIIINLQQIGAVGKASMLDIKQFAFAGIPIFEMLKETTGATGAQLEDMITNGEISFEMLQRMFNEAGEGSGRFAQAFEQQGGTFNQVLSNFRDNIGIAMGDIARQTGAFDLMKNGLKGLTDFIGTNTPAMVVMLTALFAAIADNAPTVIGFIVGGLTPAFIGLAAGIWGALAPLLPFIAAGVALGAIVQLLVTAVGGWGNVTNLLSGALSTLGGIFSTFLQPALMQLWSTISTGLLPQLRELWSLISPVLVPALQGLGSILIGVVLVALRLVIEALIWWVGTIQESVSTVNIGIRTITSLFQGLAGMISSAMSGVRNAIVRPFEDAWNSIKDIAGKISNELQKVNPFHRNSPSLVDNVVKGVDIIKSQYQSLADVALPPVSSSFLPMQQPALAGSGMAGQQQISIHIDQVGDMQDVRAIGRELGFRAGLNPSIQSL